MSPTRERRIAIACQGGGSHTAFTAGVLGRLLSSARLSGHRVVGLSGTSGGAICALIAWTALCDGDPAAAGKRLEAFWKDNAARDPASRMLNLAMVGTSVLQGLSLYPVVSPYHLPPWPDGTETFRKLLRRHVDFDAITVDHTAERPMLLLGAVDVLTGQFRAFNSRTDRITPDAVIASAAIPQLFRTVHTDGGAYWDGLFSQNPPVHDLLVTEPDELWIIQINPRRIDREPTTVTAINDRRNELSGNLSLYQELTFIEKIDELLERGQLSPASGYRQIQIRVLEKPRRELSRTLLGPASKLNRDWAFLRGLIDDGGRQADRFLAAIDFERAWRSEDLDAVLATLADDVEISTEAPFPVWSGGARPGREELGRYVRELYDAHAAVDATRKQVAEETVSWRMRVRSAEPGAAGEPARGSPR